MLVAPVEAIAAFAAAITAASSICLGRNSLMTAISAFFLLRELGPPGLAIDLPPTPGAI